MSFFSQFPKIKYDINADGVKTDLTDMFRHVDVVDDLLDDVINYTWYEIIEGERPDIVSTRLYGTPDYYWTFFVINETLKQGLNTWPKSYRQFELMLEQDYGDYSTLVFIPRQYPVARKYENSFEMLNYFGGLDIANDNIRISSFDDNPDGTKVQAEILKFDDQRFQLWVYNINNIGRFSRNRRWNIEYIDNPYTDGQEYLEFEAEKTEWAKSALEWTRKNQTTIYYSFLRDSQSRQGLITGSDAYYDFFLTKYLENIQFISHRFYESSYNSPSYFLDNENEGYKATAFDAYSQVYSLEDVELESGYFRGDIDINVSSTRDDGFDQSEIAQYNSISAQRKYIPSFVESYYTQQADYVTIKDDLSEKAFEARKIRVIRPEHITDFAEAYQKYLLK
jgi:hypothetical protein